MESQAVYGSGRVWWRLFTSLQNRKLSREEKEGTR